MDLLCFFKNLLINYTTHTNMMKKDTLIFDNLEFLTLFRKTSNQKHYLNSGHLNSLKINCFIIII